MALKPETSMFRRAVAEALLDTNRYPMQPEGTARHFMLRHISGTYSAIGVMADVYKRLVNPHYYWTIIHPNREAGDTWDAYYELRTSEDGGPSGLGYVLPYPCDAIFEDEADRLTVLLVERWWFGGADRTWIAENIYQSTMETGFCHVCENTGTVADPGPNADCEEWSTGEAYCLCHIGRALEEDNQRDVDLLLAEMTADDVVVATEVAEMEQD